MAGVSQVWFEGAGYFIGMTHNEERTAWWKEGLIGRWAVAMIT